MTATGQGRFLQQAGKALAPDGRMAAFLAAVALYALAGTPAPDHPGLIELLVGVLLAAAAGGLTALRVFRPAPGPAWRCAGQVLLIYGLSVPVLRGLTGGSDPALMLRDAVPFLFLMLPLFFQPPAEWRRPVTAAIVLSGVVFALRVAGPFLSRGDWHVLAPADPFYLANAPTVLFAALLLTGLAGRELYAGATLRRLARGGILMAAALIPLTAMALAGQRAGAGAVGLYIAFLAGLALIRSPARAAAPLFVLAILLVALWGPLQTVIQEAVQKTEAVGLNMRLQEARAVYDALGDSALSVLFGRGWGATLADPAVGGVTVNFTHSLLTTYWLKTGLCGLALAASYLFLLSRMLARLALRDPVLAGALAAPLLIDIFLYASFKSLDFGLILLLIPLWMSPSKPETAPVAPL